MPALLTQSLIQLCRPLQRVQEVIGAPFGHLLRKDFVAVRQVLCSGRDGAVGWAKGSPHPAPAQAPPQHNPKSWSRSAIPWASKNSSSELFSESRAMFCIRHSDRL